jgi:hypothetical protein
MDLRRWFFGTIRPDAVETDSITAGGLTDSNDGQAWETLREVGYQKGDFVTRIHSGDSGNASNSSNAYDGYSVRRTETELTWDIHFPGGVQGQVALEFRTSNVGSGMSVRVFNRDDSETVIERTGITSKGSLLNAGPVDYTPTTQSVPRRYRIEFLSEDGTSTVELNGVQMYFGARL